MYELSISFIGFPITFSFDIFMKIWYNLYETRCIRLRKEIDMKKFIISTLLSIFFFLMLSGTLFEGYLPEMSLGVGMLTAFISIGFLIQQCGAVRINSTPP